MKDSRTDYNSVTRKANTKNYVYLYSLLLLQNQHYVLIKEEHSRYDKLRYMYESLYAINLSCSL